MLRSRQLRSAFAATLAALVLVIAPPAFAQNYTYGAFVSGETVNVRVVARVFNEVTEETDENITWTILPGGQVADARATLAAIRDGLLDAGFIVPAFNRSELPNNSVIYEMGLVADDARAASAAATETILIDCPQCLDDYRKSNAVTLMSYSTQPFVLMCRAEVRNHSDIQGKQIRSPGGLGRWAERMGAVPVNMSGPEGMIAMQRGAIDCSIGEPDWLYTLGYADPTRYIVESHMGVAAGNSLFVLNRDVWNRLPAEYRQMLLDEMPNAIAHMTLRPGARDALERAAEDGIVVTEGGEELSELLELHLQDEREIVAREMSAQGATEPADVIEAYERNLEKWERLVQDIDSADVEGYADLLREHIYDRIEPEDL